MTTLRELEHDLYKLNSFISLHYIGFNRKPTENELIKINTELGRVIKDMRKIREEILKIKNDFIIDDEKDWQDETKEDSSTEYYLNKIIEDMQ